jgi:hypothetical protein
MVKRAKPAGEGRTRAPRKRAVPQASNGSNEAAIRQRAYELFERRGGEPGHELEDWLQAEHELREPS